MQVTEINNRFLARLAAFGVEAKLTGQDRGLWNQVLEVASYVPAIYSWSLMDYYRLLASSSNTHFADGSIIIFKDRNPVAVWPIHFTFNHEQWKVEQYAGATVPPLFVATATPKLKKELATQLQAALGEFIEQELKLASWKCQEIHADSSGLSAWHRQLMVNGGRPVVRHQLFIDLRLSPGELRSSLRKSYKSLVNSGQKLWSHEISTPTLSREIWQEFRLLHQHVAGRVTRSPVTWEAQYNAILLGEAFAIFLRDAVGKMVGAALFHISRSEGSYVLAAYDRTLFDRPLGHVVQHFAIEEMQKRALVWYKLGVRPYPQEEPCPTSKELSIGHFKEGFSTTVFPEFVTDLHISKDKSSLPGMRLDSEPAD